MQNNSSSEELTVQSILLCKFALAHARIHALPHTHKHTYMESLVIVQFSILKFPPVLYVSPASKEQSSPPPS